MISTPLSLEWYLDLRKQIRHLGYGHDILWSEDVQPVSDPLEFWAEFAFVVLNSGMKAQIAGMIWNKVRPAVLSGASASTVFGHKGKASAIDFVFTNREQLLSEYLAADDKLANLRKLPWIGNITCWHLAKNYGHDVAKPDRHLVRIAGAEGVHELCARLSRESGDRVATVDLVIWRAANLGLIESKEVSNG
jgi:hypothetical protein